MLNLGETFQEVKQKYDAGMVPDSVFRDICQLYLQFDLDTSNEGPAAADKAVIAISTAYLSGRPADHVVFQPIMYVFGGHFHLVDCMEDLNEITIMDMEWAEAHDDKWPTLMEAAGGFDIADTLKWDTDMAIFVMITNDSGGHAYYIPRKFWNKNVEVSMENYRAYHQN